MKKFFVLTIFLMMICAQASAMNLKLSQSLGNISLGANPYLLHIEGSNLPGGDYSKGAATFGDLFFHFDCTLFEDIQARGKTFEEIESLASRFGSSDFENAVPVYVFEGLTKIYRLSGDDGREFYLLATETGGGGSMKVIGSRDGKWIKFFDALDMRKQIPPEYYIENFYAEGDTIIFVYKKWQEENFCELRYKWNEAADWFGVEIIYR